MPERALLARISAGDRSAFNELVNAYLERLLGYAFSIVGSREAAEDIAQDVFCWLWDNRLTLRVTESVDAYLFTAVRHRALDQIRRWRTRQRLESGFSANDRVPGLGTPSPNADELLMAEDLAALLSRAIDELPARRREIVLLRWRQLSYGEIAESLGISVKTVEAQVTRAFETLRERLRPLVR